MKICCIIPSRYESSRFRGKPLSLIKNKTLVEHVYDNAINSDLINDVYVSTDDYRIVDFCKENNIEYISTSSECKTGTDRVYESIHKLDKYYDYYINLQGDEPLLESYIINDFIDRLLSYNNDGYIYNLMTDIRDSYKLDNFNVPKVVVDGDFRCLFMSRYPVPYNKDGGDVVYYEQLGLYAYTKDSLKLFTLNERKYSEICEGIEMLRCVENGIPLRMIYIKDIVSHAVDIPSDIGYVEKMLDKK